MNRSPMLQGKYAVVFGAGGSIGAAVAKEFAAEGAEVFLSGRNASRVEAVAKQIIADGSDANAAAIDTLDDAAVNQYVDCIVKQTGKIDILLDAAGPLAPEYGNGKLAVDLGVHHNTVAEAYRVLAEEGWLDLRRGRGAVVVERQGPKPTPEVRQGFARRLEELVAKAIADVGWGELIRQLEYKAAWYGRTVVAIDRFFPSSKRCSVCDYLLEDLDLDVRQWTCPDCGTLHDRDTNAALNIKAEGRITCWPVEEW